MSDLLELAAKVEGLTSACRETDAEIASAMGIARRSRRDGYGRSKGREWLSDSHGGEEEWDRNPPAYTASLDAAMTLVPISHLWQVKHGFGYEAIVWSAMGDYDDDGAPGSSATQSNAAITLTAAALRARASISEGAAK